MPDVSAAIDVDALTVKASNAADAGPNEIATETMHDADGHAYVRFTVGQESVIYDVDAHPSGQEIIKLAMAWGSDLGARRMRR